MSKDNDKNQNKISKEKESKNKKELKSFMKKAKAKKMAKEEMMRRKEAKDIQKNLPSNNFSLPLIPLRQGLLFPSTESVLTFGRDFSVKAIKEAAKDKKLVVLVGQKEAKVDDPKEKDCYQVGTLAVIERTLKSDGTLNALVRGIKRVKILNYLQFRPYIRAQVNQIEDQVPEDDKEVEALAGHLKKTFQKIVQMGKPVEFLNFIKLMSGVDKGEMADQIASTLNVDTAKKQVILEMTDIKKRIKKVISHLTHEMKVLEIEKDVVHKTQAKFDKHMRENILRERLKTIKKELGDYEDTEDLAEDYQEQLQEDNIPKQIRQKIKKELHRLEQMSPNNPESGYIRTWLETVFDLPWGEKDQTEIDLNKAEKILDNSHYGLDDVKDRVLEYIAVLQLKKQNKKSQSQEKSEENKDQDKKNNSSEETSQDLPTILCFVGPPGVGKTSIGRAIARSLDREFTKISLGGIRDEAQIRGHRRTYVGAMPGRIIKGIKQAGSMNPVFILDEIDKVGNDFRGDPSAALLEVLDPEQNQDFEDHYLDFPFDLSEVIFITTANTLDTVPPALKDRLEIIRYPGYTFNEKFEIAKRHLMSKVLEANGLNSKQIKIGDDSLEKIIQRYTKEAGVRELERQLGKVCRKVAKKIVSQKSKKEDAEKKSDSSKIVVDKEMIKDFLGPEKYDLTLAEEEDQVGVATGLAWTRTGGDILFIEVGLTPGKGKIRLTGKLGDVMKESAQAALTFVKSNADELDIDKDRFDKTDVHIHVPEGAVPKDGPSAGITIATAIASAFTERTVKRELAMTGEITLRGRVLRIGGLKEKVIAAHLAGIKQVIIPKKNERNLVDIPDNVKKDMEFKLADKANEVLDLTLN